jgi:hypothetical protein
VGTTRGRSGGLSRVPRMTAPGSFEVQLLEMSAQEQGSMAIALGSVLIPLADLSSRGQPLQGLRPVADTIRAKASIASVDQARHALIAMPEMAGDEEPEGLAWFTFGASVAWVYVADANTTSPADGVVNTFKRVADVLDAIDGELGDSGLLDQLLDATGSSGGAAESLAALTDGVCIAVHRLRSAEQ